MPLIVAHVYTRLQFAMGLLVELDIGALYKACEPLDEGRGAWYTAGVQIRRIICPDSIADKLETKHGVTVSEAHQVLLSGPRVRFAEKGYQEGEDVYVAFGQTLGGRYLAVFFVYKPATATAVVISARRISAKERRAYGRK